MRKRKEGLLDEVLGLRLVAYEPMRKRANVYVVRVIGFGERSRVSTPQALGEVRAIRVHRSER